MRSILLLAILFCCGLSYGQGNGFSFTYNGPTQIIVGPDCIAELEWGHPNTPTVTSNIPGGMIVSFEIYSISGGYDIGDIVGGGTVVTVFYQAVDNFGNNALFGFTISFIDVLPPVFDPLSLPQNLTVNCTGNFPVAPVEVSDNCEDQDIVLTVTYSQTNNAVLCIGGTITRTWVADDDLGNFATFIQTITVLPDVTPPVIANNLVNGSAPCATAMAQYSSWLAAQRAAFSATDNGCGVMTLSDNAPPASQITSFCGQIVVTFSAKDNCNNTSTIQRTFTVTNNVPPVINTPAGGSSGNCSQNNINQIFNTWINTHGGATATDDCSSVIWSTFPASPSLADTCDAAINVLFIAGDGCGNFDTTAASFVLTDDTPPVFMVDPSTMILGCNAPTIDSLLMDWLTTSGHSIAHDICTDDDNLIAGYRIGGNELTIDQVLMAWQDSLASGCTDNVVINGIGINNVKAYLQVQFIYDDACNNEAGKTGFFGVTDNGRPMFTSNPADTTFACSQNQNWESVFTSWYNSAGNATFTDLCSPVSLNASITADSAIEYLSAILDTACMQGVEVTIQFSLADDCGNTSINMPFATFSLQDTVAPVITTPASDLIATCALNVQLQLNNWLDTIGGASASDGCGSLMWMYSWTDNSGNQMNGIPGAGPYPAIEDLNCSEGFDVIFTVSDICQNSASDTAVFSLIDTLAPVLIIVEDSIILSCIDTIPLDTPLVTDGCNGLIQISYTEVASIDSCGGQPEIITRTWTATDECGNSSTATETFFRIDSIAPTFELPPDDVEFCSVDTLMLTNLADNCDPSPVSSFNDILTGIPCTQTLTRTWTVTDECGNSATAVQVFDLSDTSPPQIVTSPGNIVYTCNTGNVQDAFEQWQDSVQIEDGCSDADYFIAVPGSYILSDSTTWPGTPLPDSVILSCAQDINIAADLVVFDICGNVVVEQISFIVDDNTPPVFNDCPDVIAVLPDTFTCDALVTLIPPTFEEICYPDEVKLEFIIDGGDTLILDSTNILDTLMDVGIHNVQWIATDCKGNAGTCLTIIEIIDENAIVLTCPGDTVLFTSDNSCIDSLWVRPPFTSSGFCAQGVVELRFEIIGDAQPDSMAFNSPADSILVYFHAGLHEVLLIARDSTGDIDTCKYFVELRDTIDPVIICQNDTVFIHPSGADNIDLSDLSLVFSTFDNCEVDTILYDPSVITCTNAGQHIDINVIVMDGQGNSDSCTSSLFVTLLPLSPQWSRGLCNDTLYLFANIPPGPAANYTFTWTGPNGFISNVENPVIPGSDTSFNGTYNLIVESENGCISSGSVDVLIETLVSPLIVPSDDSICTGESIQIVTQLYSGNITYQWYQITPSGDTIIITTSDPSIDFSPDISGDYSFFAQVIQDTCTSAPSQEIVIFVFPTPLASIAENPFPLCESDTLFLSPTSLQNFTYEWTGPGGFISNDPLPPGILVSEIDFPAVFYLTVSSAFCTSLTDSVEINIQQTPAIPVISGDSLACEGGTFILTASAVGDIYLWIAPSLNTTLTSNTLIIPSADTSHAGGWRVIAAQNGCPSDTSESFFVRVDTALQIEIITTQHVCEGDSITLSITPDAQGIFAWEGPGNFASDEPAPTVLAGGGVYAVFVETVTGCESMDTISVNVDALPEILSLQTNVDSCVDGNTDISLWAVTISGGEGNYEFFWTGPNGFISQDSSPVINDFNSSLNGTYNLFIINGVCTTATAGIVIDVNDSPAAPIIQGESMYCFGETIQLSIASPVAGAIYTWTSADTLVMNSSGELIIPNAGQQHSGVYSVVVTIDGCTSALSTIDIDVRSALPAPVISGGPLICEGDSLVLNSNAPAGAMVNWFGPNGFTSDDQVAIIFPTLAQDEGLYSSYYILNGCVSDTSLPLLITVQPTLTAPGIVTDIVSVCADNPIPVLVCIASGTTTPGGLYSWFINGLLISGPATDSCILIDGNLFNGGVNLITANTSLQGCFSETGTASNIIGDEFPAVNADAGIDMQYCPGESIMLDAEVPFPSSGIWTSSSPVVIFLDDNNPSTEIESLPAGEYDIAWTLSFASCENYSSDTVHISILAAPQVFADTVDVPFGQTVEFFATGNDSLSGMAFTVEIVSAPQQGNVLHAGNGVFRYTPDIGFVGTDNFVYRICSIDCPEECADAMVTLRVGNEDDCFTPTLFTPNEDGINDVLIIPCLETERFPQNELIIFNEWGDAVFTAAPYLNNWDGDNLPVGTYFYIMDFGDGSTPERTFLILER